MARNWWIFPRIWRQLKIETDPVVELQHSIEDIRDLIPRLNHLMVDSRVNSLRFESHVKEVYSTNEADGKVGEPQFQDRFHALIENWRITELVFHICAFRVDLTKKALKDAMDLKRDAITAIKLGIKPPQLSAEQEALLRDVKKNKFEQEFMNSIQESIAEKDLNEYFKRLGHEIPAQVALVVNRTYEEYVDLVVKLLAKDREDVLAKQKEEVARRTATAQKSQVEQAIAVTPTKPPFIPPQREAVEEKIMESPKPKVFLIHGHDQLALKSAESLLHRIGCQPIIFSRIPDKATRTNIEILEKHLPSCDAVAVLLTPDDEGRKKGTEALEPRARQNVLVEAGFAVISRRATSLIVALGDVSIPSDFDGINRIQAPIWDNSTDINLARELSTMLGLSLDIMRF